MCTTLCLEAARGRVLTECHEPASMQSMMEVEGLWFRQDCIFAL